MTKPDRDPRGAVRRLNIAGFAAVLIFLGVAGGWAATTHIAGAVIASGSIVVENNIKKVQHNTGGIVAGIFVKEGERVEAGQMVVRLDDVLTRATLGIVQSQLEVLQAREVRLLAERDGLSELKFPQVLLARAAEPNVATAMSGEETLFISRGKSREGQRQQLRERIVQSENEVRGLEAQQSAKEKEIELIGQELKGVADLFARNLVSIVRYMALQRDKTKLEGERGQLVAETARARAKIAETEIQIIQLEQDFRTEVLKDMRDTQSKIAELQERVNAAQDELRRIDIRAPQSGIVYQLAVHTVGGVIARGDTIMQIVPSADALVVEVKVSPSDVDQVAVGSEVHVKVMTGNRRTMPDLLGNVFHVGPDLSRDQAATAGGGAVQQAYYLVRVRLTTDEVKRLGDLVLLPGMPVEVYIRTENRTPLDYILKPLTEQIARTFRER